LRTTVPVAAAVSARVAITLGGLQPLASRVLNQISASVEPSAAPAYQASAIRPSASSASVLACENGATLGSLSDANSAGKADTTGAGGAAKRGLATEGARQNARARATKKRIASAFSLSIDLDNWLPLPTNTCGLDAGKLNFRMLKKANK